MKKIQVIGLPGAGKTTRIKQFLKETNLLDIQHLDIGQLTTTWLTKEQALKKFLTKKHNLIAESACGIRRKDTIVIKVDTPPFIIYERCLIRDGFVDEDYLSLLSWQMIPASYILQTDSDLPDLLHKLFGG